MKYKLKLVLGKSRDNDDETTIVFPLDYALNRHLTVFLNIGHVVSIGMCLRLMKTRQRTKQNLNLNVISLTKISII